MLQIAGHFRPSWRARFTSKLTSIASNMIDGIVQFLLNLITGLFQAFGFSSYNTWSNPNSASSRQLWSEERQPEQQEQQQQQQRYQEV